MAGSKVSLRRFSSKSREDFFLKAIDLSKAPKHVAIILDGNGRWAQKRGLPRLAGHKAGEKAIKRIVQAAPKVGVEHLSLYTFSIENWRRPQKEVLGLMDLFRQTLEKELEELHRNQVQIRVIGRLTEVPEPTRGAFQRAIELTKNNQKLVLNIALNYGGRTEILDAVNALIEDARSGKITCVDEPGFAKHLYTAGSPDPELLIRTSGELRVSNFLLWQIAYTELWVTPVLWPDFTRKHFYQAIYEYQQRRRRFGGLDDQDLIE